ncbi:DMT family transporter [Sodalis ligni]|uniref:Threonine/homoserine exporter RhtA n=1 Tax=Sodalis ligni TaxID=2697027 RepID=A0A4R1N7K6_9GAMM|nr:DMT family transporter [Sodalis ligni]TCL03163.1 EamA-like transporter family protein [Sodalis ligni]
MIPNVHVKGAAFAILAAFCWGMALVMSKGALQSFPPIMLLLIQLTASVVFIWYIVLIKKIKIPDIRSLKKVSSLGLFEPFLTYILVLVGLTFARATDAALLQSLESIFIVIIASLLFKEKIIKFFIVLSFIIIIGLYFSIGSSLSGLIHNGMIGNLLIISGMLAAAVYVVLTSRSIAVADAIIIVAFQQVTAFLATTLAFIIEYIVTDYTFSIPSIGIVLLAIASGIFQYALAFTFYLISLKNISAGLAGMFLNLVPIFGIFGAYLFLRERMESIQIVGSIITICALLMMSMLSSKKGEH